MRLGDFDTSDFKELQRRLKDIQDDFPEFIEDCIKEIAARLLAKTIARTPVGETGDLRRGWTLGPIQRVGKGFQVEVINPVHYAPYVEYGHRTRSHTDWVEGRFMLTISEQELQRELPSILNRKLQKFMEGRL